MILEPLFDVTDDSVFFELASAVDEDKKVAATDDQGNDSGFVEAGTLAVTTK